MKNNQSPDDEGLDRIALGGEGDNVVAALELCKGVALGIPAQLHTASACFTVHHACTRKVMICTRTWPTTCRTHLSTCSRTILLIPPRWNLQQTQTKQQTICKMENAHPSTTREGVEQSRNCLEDLEVRPSYSTLLHFSWLAPAYQLQ